VDINTSIAEDLSKNNFVKREWATAEDLKEYIRESIKPTFRIAINNYLLQTSKYRTCNDSPLLEPSAASNDFRITRQDEKIAALEAKQVKVDIVAETLAREIGDLRQSKAAAVFEREEIKIKLVPQDKDAWSKFTEELKRKEILNILEGMLGNEMAARSQIFVRNANEITPPWIKVTLPSIDQKYKL
jgi:hypothetical protein